MQQAQKVVTEARAALSKDTCRIFDSRRYNAEHITASRKAIAQSRELIAEVDANYVSTSTTWIAMQTSEWSALWN